MKLLNTVLALALAATGAFATDDPSTVEISTGVLKGVVADNGKRMFAGIPFATPPVGSLRWKAPQAESSWDGVRDATRFQPVCMQSENAFTAVPFEQISEDCLYLNVFTPSVNASNADPLPVMLFFYGGSWVTGAGSSPLYWGEHLVTEAPEGAIVVTINYRLSTFGFLGGEILRDQDADGSTGNWGLLDQRRSMQWVQENIAAFGGDASRVMIFGESAGAGSVAAHVTSPRSYAQDPPLFQAAGMESGNPSTPWNSVNMTYAESHLVAVADHVGCLSSDSGEVDLDCMYAASADDLLDARHAVNGPFLDFSPTEDGVELTAAPRDLIAAGNVAQIPMLFGTNGDEGTMFISLDYDATEADYEEYALSLFGPELAAKVLEQYPYDLYNQAYEGHKAGHGAYFACARAAGDGFFTCPARRAARLLEANGATPYLYFFNHTLELLNFFRDDGRLGIGADLMGSFHGSELPFVFNLQKPLINDEEPLSVTMGEYWSSFAGNFKPSSATAGVEWESYTAASDNNMNLGTPIEDNVRATQGLKSDNCDFWDENYLAPWIIFGQP